MTFHLARGANRVRDNGLSVFAPTHQQLGIETETRRIPVLGHLDVGASHSTRHFDHETQTWPNNHLYRATITLAKGSR